jgi:hypothetical protein
VSFVRLPYEAAASKVVFKRLHVASNVFVAEPELELEPAEGERGGARGG